MAPLRAPVVNRGKAFESDLDALRTEFPKLDVGRPDWIVVFDLPTTIHTRLIYAKVAMRRPHLRTGRVIQFKPSTR